MKYIINPFNFIYEKETHLPNYENIQKINSLYDEGNEIRFLCNNTDELRDLYEYLNNYNCRFTQIITSLNFFHYDKIIDNNLLHTL